jgi:NADPH-dependent curcumin reductase CurA
MAGEINRRIILKNRPVGEPTASDFELVEGPIPQPADGQALCRTIYLSLDPYMRGRMNAGASYAKPVEVGEAMCGGTVSQVVASRDASLAVGDFVLGSDGWQEYAVSPVQSLRKLGPPAFDISECTAANIAAVAPAPGAAPISYALGVLGMPGMTAYVGMLDIGQPKAGETVLVSAAAGAVGSAAGQIARIKGARVVGMAGSDEKCRWLTEELGFDAAINYKTQPLLRALRKTCPAGIDVYFDNIGGETLATVFRLMNVGARIPLIGMISIYNATELVPGPNLSPLLVKRAMIKGMIVSDHADRAADFQRDVSQWLREGKMRCRETIVEGLENAPKAFIGLFHGENIGKLLIKV